jgi:hypothetical protein
VSDFVAVFLTVEEARSFFGCLTVTVGMLGNEFSEWWGVNARQ